MNRSEAIAAILALAEAAKGKTPGPWDANEQGVFKLGRGVIAHSPQPKYGGVMEFIANRRFIVLAGSTDFAGIAEALADPTGDDL